MLNFTDFVSHMRETLYLAVRTGKPKFAELKGGFYTPPT